MKNFFDALVQRVIARHRAVLMIALLLFAASIALSFRLRLDPDILNLVPRHNREINEFRHVLEGLGTIDQHLVVVEVPKGTDPSAYVPLIAALAERFRAMPEVASVDAEIPDLLEVAREMLPYALLYFTPAEFAKIEARLSDEAIRESVAQNAAQLQTPQSSVAKQLVQWDPFRLAPLLLEKARPGGSASLKVDTSTGYILSSDRTMFLVNVKPKQSAQNIPFARTLLERSRGVTDSAVAAFRRENPDAKPPSIGFAGGYAVAVSDAGLIRKDVTINVVSSLVLILLLFLYAFRSLASIAYAAVPMIFSIALTFGFATLALGRLSSASAVFGALVAGLGIDFVTITYERYLDQRNTGVGVPAALRTAYVATMPGVVVAAITTAGTFYAYLLTDYRGMSELGLLVGTGVVLFLLAVAVVLPALIVAVEGRRSVHRQVKLRSFGAGHLISAAVRRPGMTIALWLVAIAIAAFAARGVRFDPEISSFRSKDNPAAALQERVSKAFGQGFSAMLYVEEKPTLDAALDATARQRPELDRLVREGAIGSYQSIATLLPPLEQQRAIIALAESRAATTLDFARIERTFREALEANGFRSTAYDDYLESFRALLRPAKPLDYATLQQTSLAPLLQRFVRQRDNRWMSVTMLYPKNRAWPSDVPQPIMRWREKTDAIVTGVNLVSMTLRRIIQRDAVRSTLWGAVAVFLLFALFQRSLLRAALMFVPLLAGCTLMVGLMSAFGLRFNLVNAFVGLMLVGVATDYAIYIVQSYLEDPQNFAAHSPDTAKAVAMAALTSMVGFGSFVTSHFPGMRSIGYTSLLGIGFSCLAAITLLPAILALRTRRTGTTLNSDAQSSPSS
ncbi:MAG TPA: MMPL family transporter [Thermoanaerobaculia bacterium]|nr:MMPL family transporter [Thermoanaerobaculia bacterium]